jgi:hypothetical protein
VCREARIQPFTVVVGFAALVIQKQILPRDRIPPALLPPPPPSQRTMARAKPTPKRVAPVEETYEDVEMPDRSSSEVEDPIPVASKRKARAVDVSEEAIEPVVEGSKKAKGKKRAEGVGLAGTTAGSKRAQPTSPVQQVSYKRSKKALRTQVDPHDLSGFVFGDGELIDLDMVPELKDQVSRFLLSTPIAA